MTDDWEEQVKDLAWKVAQAIDLANMDMALAAIALVARVAIDKCPEEDRASFRHNFVRRIGYREH